VLDTLRWQRTAAFETRFARLQPRGQVATMVELLATDLYQSARRDLAEMEG